MTDTQKREKVCYLGAPAIFLLDQACTVLYDAFGHYPYLVGSCLEKADWRDVDVRLMLPDDEFETLFPNTPLKNAAWELDPRWRLMTISIAHHLSEVTGLPVDFQFQPVTFANEKHNKLRNPLGIRIVK